MKIITQEATAEIKIQRSQFICHLSPVSSIEEAKDYIRLVSKKHNKAHHNCWAYIVGEKGEISHSSDNGEPSGTAGKPMLRVLQQHELTNVVAVVTRYFGGVKLGVRGLIDAYSEATEEAINSSDLQVSVKKLLYSIQFEYSHHDKILYELQKLNVVIVNTEYLEHIILHLSVVEDDHENLRKFLEENKHKNLKIINAP